MYFDHLLAGKCQAIIGNGLSMGRPCCGVVRCQEPLENNWHWFCATHNSLHNICAIINCDNPILQFEKEDPKGRPPKIVKKKTCSLPTHQQIETKHHEHSTGSFLYKERLQYVQVSQPLDSLATSCHVPEQDIQEDFETYTVHRDNVWMHVEPGIVGVVDPVMVTTTTENIPCPSKSATGNWPQLKA